MVRKQPTNNQRVDVANTDERRDESFNSITGLNGSGKSNILDSICFVLGITNMSTVRAQNLQVRNCPKLFKSIFVERWLFFNMYGNNRI